MKNFSEKTQSKLYEIGISFLGKNKKPKANKFKLTLEEVEDKKYYSDTEVDDLVGRSSKNIATRSNSLNVSYEENEEYEDINNEIYNFENHFEELVLK